MNCPLKSDETLDILLDFSAGRLDCARAAEFALHMDVCPACATCRAEQAALWRTLDEWRPEPVSVGFSRSLWKKIDAAESVPWYRGFAVALRSGAWKPAIPVGAAVLALAAGFLLDHRSPAIPASAAAELAPEVNQIEEALEDVQLLRQFDVGPQEIPGSRPL